jgi:hypothetical protein
MRRIIIALSLASVVAPNVALAKKAPELTPLQLQAMQSRDFETSKENLFSATMTVLQDLGYQVQSADLNTGFITAVSATQNKANFWDVIGGASASGVTKVTVFIMSLPNGMAKVRLNFLSTKQTSSMYGQSSQQDKPILDTKVYTNAWDKIDEALFVMGALQPSTTERSVPVQGNGSKAPAEQPRSANSPPSSVNSSGLIRPKR